MNSNVALLAQKYERLELVCHHANIKGRDTAESMIRDIDRIRTSVAVSREVAEEARHSLMSAYLREIWVTELDNIADNQDTVDICEALFEEKKDVGEMIKRVFPRLDAKTATRELRNLYHACNALFASDSKTDPLSIPFIQEINTMVMKDVLLSAGQFRTKGASALGCGVQYCLPSQIKDQLTALCTFVNQLERSTATTRDVIRRAAFFFSEFLLIHPFEDGNGRTARLLLSHLLRSVSVVPVSLYLDTVNPRAVYLEALNARNDRRFPPEKVASLVLTCVHRTACDYQYLSNPYSVEEEVIREESSPWKALVMAALVCSALFVFVKQQR